MEFYVVYCEQHKTVYDFSKNQFVSEKEITKGCLLPTITFALKVTKFPHLFLRINPTSKLHAKKVTVEKINKDNENEEKIEVII